MVAKAFSLDVDFQFINDVGEPNAGKIRPTRLERTIFAENAVQSEQSGCSVHGQHLPRAQMSYDHLRSAPIRRLHNPLEENPIWRILGRAIASVFAVAVGLPFLLAFFFLLPACLSVRWLLLLIHWNRRGTQTGHGPESVRGNDSRWLGAAWNSSVIHAVLVFEANDRLNVDNFRRLLLARVVPLYPRLTRRPVSLPLSAGTGHCWLQDLKFSIDRHVFPGPSLSCEKDLQNYVSELLKDGLPQDKPPWEFQILHPFGERRDTVAVLRVHQSIADGTALLRVLCQSLADSQEIEIPQGPTYGSFSFCINVFRACIVGPLSILVWLFFSAEDCNVLTRRSSWTGSLRVTWSASITLPKVIRIKQVTRSTVNCVLLSALAGALRRFLQGCGVKHPPDIKVVMPMDLRTPATSQKISSRLGNKSSPVFVSLPVAVEGCVPRLWATRKALDSLRNSADPVILYVATTALMSVGPASVARDLLDVLTDKASLQFASLPGPTSEIYIGGQTLKSIYPLLPAQARLGISITAITYADQVFVSVIAERALGPAAELILEYLEDQVEILWNLLLHRRVPGESRNTMPFPRDPDSPMDDVDFVQQEVQRLNEKSDEDGKLGNLKSEFSELVGALKRRHSLHEMNELDVARRPKRRASCTASKKLNPFLQQDELDGIKEEDGTGFKEVVCLLTDTSDASPIGADHGKIKAKMKRNKLESDESIAIYKRENFTSFIHEKKIREDKKPLETSVEMRTETGFKRELPRESSDEFENLTSYLGPINADLKDLYCSNFLHHRLETLRREKKRLEQEMTPPRFNENGFDDGGDDDDIAGGVLI